MQEANSTFNEMTGKGIVPDSIVYNILMRVHVKMGNIEEVYKLQSDMEKRGIAPI